MNRDALLAIFCAVLTGLCLVGSYACAMTSVGSPIEPWWATLAILTLMGAVVSTVAAVLHFGCWVGDR